VFEVTHGLVLELVADGVVDGLRIDHPDGLADPAGYLARLRERGVGHVWVEKILAASERLPQAWPVEGTVGYEFLNEALGLFVDPSGEPTLTELWERLSGDGRPFGAQALDAKLEQALTTFAPELARLARAAGAPAVCAASAAPAEPAGLALALASSPVYRTYEPPAAGEFLTRFQQTSPAVVAKGVEDTAFYRYARLLALNEVGGDPGRFGVCVEDFHAACAERAVAHPRTLLATMTHDTKRSLDARTRIAVLAQVPERWAGFARGWLEGSERWCATVEGRAAPDLADRYLILQTLVAVWPVAPERLDCYLEKALREAKRRSSWIAPDEPYEQAVKRYARELSADAGFREEIAVLLAELAPLALRATLGQLLLKLTCPGVPDIYQGDEHEFLALVDPDNRRPVDFALRRERLDRLLAAGPPDERHALGDHKLWLTARLLGLRRRRPEIFAGAYEPLAAGAAACVFMRGERELLVAVSLPRAAADPDPLVQGLPAGSWRELLSGRECSIGAAPRLSLLVDATLGLGVHERL
jgi:(1->4)-alpha-D-glucan 1-alpha-D-glucosylmutase